MSKEELHQEILKNSEHIKDERYSNLRNIILNMDDSLLLEILSSDENKNQVFKNDLKRISRSNRIFTSHFCNILKSKMEPKVVFELLFNKNIVYMVGSERDIIEKIMLKNSDFFFTSKSCANNFSSKLLDIDDVFFHLIESSFFENNPQVIKKMNTQQKSQIIDLSLTHLYKKEYKEHILNLIFSVDRWFEYNANVYDEHNYIFSVILNNLSGLKTIKEEKKLHAILLNNLTEDAILHCKKEKINLFEMVLNDPYFTVNKKLLKKFSQTILNNEYLENNKNIPFFLNKPSMMRKEFINDLYDEYKNILGVENLIGTKKQQKELFNIITEVSNNDFRGYNVLFTQSGKSSAFVKLLTKISKEPSCIEDLKNLAVFTNIAMHRGSVKYNTEMIFEKTKVITDKNIFDRIIDSNIANICLINLEDKTIKKQLILRQKSYIEKNEIEKVIGVNISSNKINKKRI